MNGTASTAPQEPELNMLISLLEDIANRGESLATYGANKADALMGRNGPTPAQDGKCSPPLAGDLTSRMRDVASKISCALDSIDNSLNRIAYIS